MKKFYVTTSIPYVNAAPHIGFALEIVQADVLARYHRVLGEEVFFLTGTDEHGQKQYNTARELGKDVKEWADENSAKFRKLAKDLDISNDDFIRTTNQKRHWPTAQKIWIILKEKGDIYKGKYAGFYCVGCEQFVTEKELVDGKCPEHNKEPQKIEEENWFFALSKYSNKIGQLIESDELKIVPESRKREMLSLIKREGLRDIAFSRPRSSLPWGIPVPDDPKQVMYVWGDALTNYLSGLGYESQQIQNSKFKNQNDKSKFKKFWPPSVHCIGKGILRFHAGIWPGMLLSAGLDLPKTIFVHGYIVSDGQKMSKSLGNVVNPFEYIEKYGADAVRYYLLRKIPSSGDGDFSEEKFIKAYNSDLANDLGNLVLRVVTLAEKIDIVRDFLSSRRKSGSRIKTWIPHPASPAGGQVRNDKGKSRHDIALFFGNFQFDRAMDVIWQDIASMNREIDQVKLWELVKTDREKAKKILKDLIYRLLSTGYWLRIFLPNTAQKMEQILTTGKKEVLFPKL